VKILTILLENKRNLYKDGTRSRLQKKLFMLSCEFSEPNYIEKKRALYPVIDKLITGSKIIT